MNSLKHTRKRKVALCKRPAWKQYPPASVVKVVPMDLMDIYQAGIKYTEKPGDWMHYFILHILLILASLALVGNIAAVIDSLFFGGEF